MTLTGRLTTTEPGSESISYDFVQGTNFSLFSDIL